MVNRKLEVRKIVEALGISQDSVVSVWIDHLDIRKAFARCVSCLLTIDHKDNRVTSSKKCLALFNQDPDEFWAILQPWTKNGLPTTQ